MSDLRLTRNERGSMLLACLIMTSAVLAGMVAFSGCLRSAVRSNATTTQTQRTYYGAESGIYAGIEWLKNPQSASIDTTLREVPNLVQGARVFMQRSASDPSHVTIISRTTMEATTGRHVDGSGNATHESVIRAEVKVEFTGDYFAAVPGTLQIAPGSDISGGKIYGRDIVFMPGPITNRTKVGSAFYFNSVTDGTRSNPAPVNVEFTTAPARAQQVAEVSVPHVASMEPYYLSVATNPVAPCMLPAGTVLSGTWTAPNGSSLCYCEGDLILGDTSGLLAQGITTIFVRGDIRIENNVRSQDPGGLSLLSQGNVLIGSHAPDELRIQATAIVDGAVRAEGPVRPHGRLQFEGGMSAQLGISLSQFNQSRQYTFASSLSTSLPYIVRIESWQVDEGKYY